MTRAWLLVLVACSSPSSNVPASPDAPSPPPPPSPDAPIAARCDDKQPQPRDATWSVTVGSLARTAKVHVPASYDPRTPVPLVINLHGRTGNATSQEIISHSIAKSDAAGFVAIHPEAWGSPTSWNAGGGCCDPAYSNAIDDTGFVAKLIDEASARLCLDADRVYVMGLSNGGYLAHRIGCELSDRVAAIGAVAGLLSLPSCAPARPVPVWLVHGTDDQIVGYGYVDETIAFWGATNQCTSTATTYTNGDASCVTHAGCASGADVVACTIAGGGHQWPGGEALPFMGKKSDDLIATDAMWEFFVAHPRPAVP